MGKRPPEFPFGLSADQFAKLTRKMLGVARRVTRHSGASPEDAVQQAFVKALLKPGNELPSIQNHKEFVARMCELVKYEALTIRTDQRRRAEREIGAGTDIAELAGVPPATGVVEARKMLDCAITELDLEDRAFLHALFAEGKTISEIAREQGEPRSTVESRHLRLLKLLYAHVQAKVAALLVLLLPKKARAFVANVTQRAPHVMVQATQFSGALAVTVVCGALLPTGSSANTPPTMAMGLTPYSIPESVTTQAARLPPTFIPEVAPEEPEALDTVTNPCSGMDMKSAKIAGYLQATALPFALLVAPALTQVACAGTEQTPPPQTPPPRQPVDDDEADRRRENDVFYRAYCNQERARGNKCMSREEWDAEY
ncbi:MAG: sigma-70 family RNA polymerase sigma factor [Polyangiaceae bacterium]|nr:sigma-70 family RNA polymerase sigma factor [Polyangiaceae bacterium]